MPITALAQTAPRADTSATDAAVSPGGTETLLLAATVNGTTTDQLLTIVRAADGGFVAKADELRALRIRIAPTANHGGQVRLDTIPGLRFTYDEGAQSIAFAVPDNLLDAYRVGYGDDRQRVDLSLIHPMSGVIANYELYAATGSGYSMLSGNGEIVGMTPIGIFTTSGLFNTQRSYGGNAAVRLDSSWRFIDAQRVRSYTVGDFASNALAWTGSVRLGGFQISSAFEQRSDIVTNALPQFSGSAALPSTLDLYVDQQKVFSGETPAGPFQLKSLPYLSGGNVQLVTTDATGRQVQITRSYYATPGQLRAGLLEYSIDVGAPRLDYGTRSFRYDHVLMGSGSFRYGLTDTTTLEGQAQASSDGLANGGAGLIQSIAGRGAITASVAASRYRGRSGGKISVRGEGYLGGVRFQVSTERATHDYFDLARVSELRAQRQAANAGDPALLLASTAQARSIDQASISFTPKFDKTSVNLSYSAIKSALETQRLANLSLSRNFSNRLTAYVSAYGDINDRHRYGAFASLAFRFGRSNTASVGVQSDGGQTSANFDVEHAQGQQQGELGWGVSDREAQGDGTDQRRAYVSYRAPQALLRAEVDQNGSQWQASLDAQGSLVLAGGGLFAADRIGQSFAIVRNAGPGTQVIQGGVPIAKANASGHALLPDLQPYYQQQVFIDPATLPDGWEAAATERAAVAGYRQGAIVDFGVRAVHAAIVTLVDAKGKTLPAGYELRLASGGSALIGYDGEAYVRDLQPINRITVDLGLAGVCSAQFAYDSNGPAQARIGPVTCR